MPEKANLSKEGLEKFGERKNKNKENKEKFFYATLWRYEPNNFTLIIFSMMPLLFCSLFWLGDELVLSITPLVA